jgi:hypothetical protein
MGEKRNSHGTVGKPEENKPLQRPRLGWEGGFKMYHEQDEGVNWIHLACDRIHWAGSL